LTGATGLFGPGIAHQPLHGHARLTRLGVRSAFAWAFIGLAIISAGTLGLASSYLQVSAARHALALGFVTLMIYSVASRALPAFLGRRLWSTRLQAATLTVANVGVALRVVPQLAAGTDALSDALVGLSGILAYVALVLFTLNVVRTLRGPSAPAVVAGAPVPLEIRFSRGP
jgi:NnrS protein